MSRVWMDLRYAARQLRKSPGFTTVAVLTLALGIGANTAVFSIFDEVILQLLPVKNPRELVLVDVTGPQMQGWATSDNRHTVHSYPTYLDLKERSKVFDGVIARSVAPVALAHGGESQRADGELVSGNFFPVLGVRPFLGRLIQEEDDRSENAHAVAVLSHGYWQRPFADREDIINRKITLNGHPMVVIGVAPPTFRGVLSGRSPEVYMPLAMRRQMRPALFARPGISERETRYLNVLARLKPGVTREQAEAATQGVFRGILEEIVAGLESRLGPMRAQSRQEYFSKKVQLVPAYQGIHALRDSLEKPLAWLSGMVGVLLLIACVNVAGLLVARAGARRREVAVRLALGSGRGALVRQLLAESVLLAALGGLAGLLVASWTMDLLTQLSSSGERALFPRLDTRVLGFNFALATLTGLLFGLAPAWQAARTSVVEALKSQSAGATGRSRGTGFRKVAVVAQVALSVLLLVAGGLFARSLHNLRNLYPGFRTENIATFTLDPQLSGYGQDRGRILYEELLRRFRQLPGVVEAGAAEIPLLVSSERGGSITVEGFRGEHSGSSRNLVSTGFFGAVGIPVVLGRPFTEME